MKHTDSTSLYLADEGKTFRRRSDGFTMGTGIDLGVNDSIGNYIEDDMTDEEKAAVEAEKAAWAAKSVTSKSRIHGNK